MLDLQFYRTQERNFDLRTLGLISFYRSSKVFFIVFQEDAHPGLLIRTDFVRLIL